MANDASIEKIGKNITSLAKKKPGLFYGSIAGVVVIGAFIYLRGKNSSSETGLMYYSEPIEPIQTGEGGLTEADIANLLAERDEFISDQFAMVYDDIYSGFNSIARQLAELAESQQRIDYSFPPNYPYIPNIPEIDNFPVDTTTRSYSSSDDQFSRAIADIQRNESLFFSPSVLLSEKQVLDMGDWSALDIYWQEQGSTGTSKNLPVNKDQIVVYKPDGQVIVMDRSDYAQYQASKPASSGGGSGGSSSSSSSSKEVGYSYSAGTSSKNPPSDGGKWSYSPSKNTWTKVG